MGKNEFIAPMGEYHRDFEIEIPDRILEERLKDAGIVIEMEEGKKMDSQLAISNLIFMKTEIKYESDEPESIKKVKSDTISEAIKALKKQKPMKPIISTLYACPNCHKIMLQGAFEVRGKYCKECGQMIDWSEIL